MAIERSQVVSLVHSVIEELNEDWEIESLNQLDDDTRLYGADGVLDSLGLVSLISDLEDKIDDDWEIEVSLADERAMSHPEPPFHTVGSLIKYICLLIEES